MIVKARYVVPVSSPPIEDGAIAIQDGVITEIGPAKNLSGSPVTDFQEAVICPGLVNAHTHLELSLLKDRVPPSSDLTDWLTRLVAILRAEPPTQESVTTAIRDGVEQSIRSGTTLIGDITRSPAWSRSVLSKADLRAVSFGEVIAIGTLRNRCHKQIEEALSSRWSSDRLRLGLSPHSPYTVEPDAMGECAKRAASANAPLCIHLAETYDEAQFTQHTTGPLAAYLKELGVWDEAIPKGGCNPVELIDRVGMLTPRTLLAHANYVDDQDIRRIAATGASVAYCPRTHHAFGHKPHRYREMLQAGINVCLGTDSLASNPSLSVLDEIRFLHEHHRDVDPAVLLRMATIHGAKALGYDDITGTLEAGKSAGLVVIPLDGSDKTRSWSAILDSDAEPMAVYFQGRRVH